MKRNTGKGYLKAGLQEWEGVAYETKRPQTFFGYDDHHGLSRGLPSSRSVLQANEPGVGPAWHGCDHGPEPGESLGRIPRPDHSILGFRRWQAGCDSVFGRSGNRRGRKGPTDREHPYTAAD